jgi:hypothetical protein
LVTPGLAARRKVDGHELENFPTAAIGHAPAAGASRSRGTLRARGGSVAARPPPTVVRVERLARCGELSIEIRSHLSNGPGVGMQWSCTEEIMMGLYF